MVPLVGRAAEALRLYWKESRPRLAKGPRQRALFIGWRKRRLPPGGLQQMVRRHSIAAGLGAFHPHALRHACATHLLAGGASVRHVQELLGHKSLNTTMRYTRVEISDLSRVVHRAHPRARWRREPAGRRMTAGR